MENRLRVIRLKIRTPMTRFYSERHFSKINVYKHTLSKEERFVRWNQR